MKSSSCEPVARKNATIAVGYVGRCDSVATRGPRLLLDELSSSGVRITAQRRAVIEVIQDARKHLDAVTLLTAAKERVPSIDRATVYRTIDLLKRLGLIDELDLMHLEGEKHFYEVKSRKDHIHLACFHCGRIEEFSAPLFERLKQEINQEARFRVRVARMEVGGTCSTCAEQATALEGEKGKSRAASSS